MKVLLAVHRIGWLLMVLGLIAFTSAPALAQGVPRGAKRAGNGRYYYPEAYRGNLSFKAVRAEVKEEAPPDETTQKKPRRRPKKPKMVWNLVGVDRKAMSGRPILLLVDPGKGVGTKLADSLIRDRQSVVEKGGAFRRLRLDTTGVDKLVLASLGVRPGAAALLILDFRGRVLSRFSGRATTSALVQAMERAKKMCEQLARYLEQKAAKEARDEARRREREEKRRARGK